jgi:hypothetical protein
LLLASWVLIHTAHVSNVISKLDPDRLTMDQWRVALDYARKRFRTSTQPGTTLNDDPYFSNLFSHSSTSTSVMWADREIPMTSEAAVTAAIDDDLSSEMIWTLCEQGFRVELLYLDQYMAAPKWKSGTDEDRAVRLARDEAVRKVFCSQHNEVPPSYFLTAIPNVPFGLSCHDWEDRREALVALRDLMRDWSGCPDLVRSDSALLSEAAVVELEASITRFYCQSFWETFGRAPIIPHHLAHMSLSRHHPASFLPS